MSGVTPKLRNFAERLVAYEAENNPTSRSKIPAACLASEKLRPHLATVMGNVGFRALLTRSLALGRADVPWLGEVHVNADGSFEGFETLGLKVDPDEFFKGCVVLLAYLLGLLVAFIGEELTLRLAGDVWPEQTFGNSDLSEGGE